jgi:hypothetical protein
MTRCIRGAICLLLIWAAPASFARELPPRTATLQAVVAQAERFADEDKLDGDAWTLTGVELHFSFEKPRAETLGEDSYAKAFGTALRGHDYWQACYGRRKAVRALMVGGRLQDMQTGGARCYFLDAATLELLWTLRSR